MKRLLGILVAVALAGCYATVGEHRQGRGEAGLTVSFPEELPPLVVVQPGVSVVSDYDQEVFYTDGYYWVRQDGAWYRSQDHRRGWTRAEPRVVPASIAQSPPGRYRHYRGDEHQRDDREHGRDDRERGRDDREHGEHPGR